MSRNGEPPSAEEEEAYLRAIAERGFEPHTYAALADEIYESYRRSESYRRFLDPVNNEPSELPDDLTRCWDDAEKDYRDYTRAYLLHAHAPSMFPSTDNTTRVESVVAADTVGIVADPTASFTSEGGSNFGSEAAFDGSWAHTSRGYSSPTMVGSTPATTCSDDPESTSGGSSVMMESSIAEQAKQLRDAIALQTTLIEQLRHLSDAGGIHCSEEQTRQLSDALALQTTLMEQVRHLGNAGSIHCSECLGFYGFPLHEFWKCAYCNAIVCLRCTYTTGILCPALPSECPHRYVRIEEQASSQGVHPMQTASQSSSSDRPHHNEQQQWSAIYRIDTLARWEHLVRTRRLLDAHRNMRP